MTEPLDTTLGDLVSAIYEAHLDELEDPELAAVATSVMLNELLTEASLAFEAAATDAA